MTAPILGAQAFDPIVYPACLDILTALRAEFAKVPAGGLPGVAPSPAAFTFPGPPQHFRIVPGTENVFELSALQDICCEGVAWVRVQTFYHTVEFPNPAPVFEPGGEVSWTIVCELGSARCSGLMSPDPNRPELAPTDDQYNFASWVLFNDAAALRRVGPNLVRNRPELILDYMYGPGAWDPIAVEGNCSGGVLVLSVQVPAVDASMAG